MKAVFPEVPQHVLDHRSRTGADMWDEMWEGVLHMPPVPNREHQDLALTLAFWLRTHWAVPRGNRVHGPINVASPGGWPNDYRIPDLVLLTPERFETAVRTNPARTADRQPPFSNITHGQAIPEWKGGQIPRKIPKQLESRALLPNRSIFSKQIRAFVPEVTSDRPQCPPATVAAERAVRGTRGVPFALRS